MPSYQKIEKISVKIKTNEKKEKEKEVKSRPIICNHGWLGHAQPPWLGYPATGYDPITS
jgi:hypothetical protein